MLSFSPAPRRLFSQDIIIHILVHANYHWKCEVDNLFAQDRMMCTSVLRSTQRRMSNSESYPPHSPTFLLQAGDVARSTGQAGLAVVEKGKEINTQYGVTDKVWRDAFFGVPHVLQEKNISTAVPLCHSHLNTPGTCGARRCWRFLRCSAVFLSR